MSAVPAWLRIACAIDRSAHSLVAVESAVLNRLACTFVGGSQRPAVTTWIYGRRREYLPGSSLHSNGLFWWEQAAIATGSFPRHGRLLLGAAGGGRELDALCASGYAVTAFEPSPVLVEAARAVAARWPNAEVVQASFEDLIDHVEGRPTPFDGALDGPFDGVVIGYGGFCHLYEERARLALLEAVRSVARTAPVLVSFNRQATPSPGYGPRTQRALDLLRRLGVRPSPPPPGLDFTTFYGFQHQLAHDEIDRLSALAGYTVAYLDTRSYPIAVLVPTAQ
jgi:hypothetical protein